MNRCVFNRLQLIYLIILTMYPIILTHLNNILSDQSFANEKEREFIFLDKFYPYFAASSSCAFHSVTYLKRKFGSFFSIVLKLD